MRSDKHWKWVEGVGGGQVSKSLRTQAEIGFLCVCAMRSYWMF